MLKRFRGARGKVVLLPHESDCLRDNPLGDPWQRSVAVYLPPGYETERDRRYPVLFSLAGFTGSGLWQIAWKNFQESHPERLDRLIGSGAIGPVIMVFPDCFTAYGGNQYIDSSAIGLYEQYLTRELVPFIDRELRTLASREHRGILGKSSGGYGAILHGMRHADVWGAVACHSGDMYFELCYLKDLPRFLDVLARHDRSPEVFLRAFHEKQKPSSEEVETLMFLAMAASYDPDPAAPLGFQLPCDLETGELREDRWRRWRMLDPIHMAGEHAQSLRRLKLLYLDCGSRDQYGLHYGARILSRRLRSAGISFTHEEFEDDHSSVDYRLDRSLPLLYEALAPR